MCVTGQIKQSWEKKGKLWMDHELPLVSLNRFHSPFNERTSTSQPFSAALNATHLFISMFLCESLNESDNRSVTEKWYFPLYNLSDTALARLSRIHPPRSLPVVDNSCAFAEPGVSINCVMGLSVNIWPVCTGQTLLNCSSIQFNLQTP